MAEVGELYSSYETTRLCFSSLHTYLINVALKLAIVECLTSRVWDPRIQVFRFENATALESLYYLKLSGKKTDKSPKANGKALRFLDDREEKQSHCLSALAQTFAYNRVRLINVVHVVIQEGQLNCGF